MSNTPSDAEIDEVTLDILGYAALDKETNETARMIARAVLAKWGTPQPVAREPLSDEEVDSLCKVGPVYAPDGKVTLTPPQYKYELESAQRYGLRKGERAHGIKGDQHGTESST